jgi:hypothetical protein
LKILDATAGSRAVWFDKNYRDTTYLDLVDRRYHGNELGDCRHTRFENGEFDIVVFDPPHMNVGPTSSMAQSYGHFTTHEIRELVRDAFAEFHRILRADGLVAFKWADHDMSLDKILSPVRGFDRLVGVPTAMRTKHSSQTFWVLMRKVPIREPLFDAIRTEGGKP